MDEPPVAAASENQRVELAIGVGLAGSVALLGRELFLWNPRSFLYQGGSELERFAFDASGGNHQLGLVLCALLVWRRRRDLARGVGAPPGLGGSLLLGLAAVIASGWSTHTGAVYLLLPAIALWLLGAGMALSGPRGGRALLVPACVLLVTTPLPVAFVNALIHPMQMTTAATVSWALDLLSIDHVRAAEYVYVQQHVFYVVEGCAGLGILQTMVLASLVLGEFLDYDWRAHLRLMGMAVVVALVANQLRVLTIVLLPESTLARDHEMQGLLMVVLSVVVLGILDAQLGRRSAGPSGADVAASLDDGAAASGDVVSRLAVVTVAGSAALFIAAGMVVPRWTPAESTLPRAADVSKELEGLRARRSLTLDREYLGSVLWSDRVYRRYVGGEPQRPVEIDALVLVDHGRDLAHDIVSPKVVRTKPGLVVLESSTVRLPSSGRRVELIRAARGPSVETIVFFRVAHRSPFWRFVRSVLAIDQSIWHQPEPDVAVRLAVAQPVGAPIDARADDRLIRFADAFEQSLVEVGVLSSIEDGATRDPGPG